MATVAIYVPTEIFASDKEVTTDKVTVVTGQNLAALSLVEYDTAGKIIAHGGANMPAGVLVAAVDATAADVEGSIYATGCFFADKLVWNAAQSTDLLKQLAIANSGVQVKFYGAGE